MNRLVVLGLAACIAGCAARQRPGRASDGSTCAALPLLAAWERAGLARSEGDAAHLSFAADLHGRDCGVPDCYGTRVEVDLRLVARGPRCVADGAVVRTREYVRCGGADDGEGEVEAETYSVEDAPDLASSATERLVLRSASGRRALVVRPDGASWFDDVVPGAPLREALPPDDAEDASCCWATGMSRGQLTGK